MSSIFGGADTSAYERERERAENERAAEEAKQRKALDEQQRYTAGQGRGRAAASRSLLGQSLGSLGELL